MTVSFSADTIPVIAIATINKTRNVFFIIDLNSILKFINDSLFSWENDDFTINEKITPKRFRQVPYYFAQGYTKQMHATL